MNIGLIGQQCAGKTTIANMLKEENLGVVVKFAQPLYAINDVLGAEKVRGFMQEQSDIAKKYFGRRIFIELFEKLISKYPNTPLFCDDVRYQMEAEYLKEAGWTLVYVEASRDTRKARAANLGLEFIENHSSEVDVPDLKQLCDKVIYNDEICLGNLRSSILHWEF